LLHAVPFLLAPAGAGGLRPPRPARAGFLLLMPDLLRPGRLGPTAKALGQRVGRSGNMLTDVAEAMMPPVFALTRFAIDVVQANGIRPPSVAAVDQEQIPGLTNRARFRKVDPPSNSGSVYATLVLHWNPQFLCRGPGDGRPAGPSFTTGASYHIWLHACNPYGKIICRQARRKTDETDKDRLTI
jgi:hypothetical protein